MSRLLPLAAAIVLCSSVAAFAQAPAPAASQPATTKAKAPPKTATTPEGIECSAQADAKQLKGKDRRTFRSKCIRAMKKKGSGSGSGK